MRHYHSVTWKPSGAGQELNCSQQTSPCQPLASLAFKERPGDPDSQLQPGLALDDRPGWARASRAGEENVFSLWIQGLL